MNILYLQEFLVLASTKSYIDASARLYMNQSTLSKHIKALEKELGVVLFDRSTRRVHLTEYGQQLLPYARQITDLATLYESERNRINTNILTIGTIPTMAQYDIVRLILSFKEEYPDVHLKIIEGDTVELRDGLLKNHYDLAFLRDVHPSLFVSSPLDHAIEKIPYQADRLVAVVPTGHPLFYNEYITFPQLKDYRLCLLKENTLLYNFCVQSCKAANFVPNIFYESHRISNIVEMCAQGDCIALLLDQHLQAPSTKSALKELHLAMIPIDPPVTTIVSLCYLKKDKLSELEKKFLLFFRKTIDSK